ncbi:MAG TPA: phospholipase [Saprospirales bacterium]|nr:phospholipase [Saprospirales bacterium]
MSMSKVPFGLVLSGGGTRGATHIGVMKALQEAGIRPDIIAGCSAGALIGAFFAAGHSAETTYTFFKETSLFSHPSFKLAKPGLFNAEKYLDDLAPFFPENSFESLSIPLKIYSTDLISGRLIEHHSGELLRPVMASCCIPGIFTPIEMDGQLLSDGGIMSILPVSPVRNIAEKILGVMIALPAPEKSARQIKHLHQVLDRALTLAIYSKAERELELCDWVIEPLEIGTFNMISKQNIEVMYETGYRYGMELIPEIMLSLNLPLAQCPESDFQSN